MHRRIFLRTATVGAGAIAFSGSLWHPAAASEAVRVDPGPYGPLQGPDSNGVALPVGFTSRIVARSLQLVGGMRWHPAPDGGACFADGDGWIYVSNSQLPLVGGTSAVRFGGSGDIKEAYSILSGTHLNSAGGATSWNTWLSCEKIYCGKVYETDPFGDRPGLARPAMGRFKHESAACDEERQVIYLTEDEIDGCFYRFTPQTWGDLSSGRLEVLCGEDSAEWVTVPDPEPGILGTQTRYQVAGARHFSGGEGCYYADGVCYFAAKGDSKVWAYDTKHQTVAAVYDDADGIDHITGNGAGDLYVAEEGGNMEINMITRDNVVSPVLRLDGHDGSEITGPAFSPDGSRLYFSSQRGLTGESAGSGGITFEVMGPFRQ